MAYETKVLLAAFAEIVRNNEKQEDIYKALMRLANVEGVILKPLDEDNDFKKPDNDSKSQKNK